MRAAELAGLEVGQVLAAAIGERDPAGTRDLAAVIDARLRYRIGTLVPAQAGPWSAQVAVIADAKRRTYLTQIAAMMDARRTASAGTPPSTPALAGPGAGPRPPGLAGPAGRAATIGAWRELSGHCDPADPIGPEPVAAAPDMVPASYGMPIDGGVLHRRYSYRVARVTLRGRLP
jgi:hypothetical protein